MAFSIMTTAPLTFAQDKDAMINQALDAASGSPDGATDIPVDPTVGILDFQDQDILDVLRVISEKTRLHMIADDHIRGRVTVYLDNVDVWDALRTILEMHDLAYVADGNQVTIMTDDEFFALKGHQFNKTIQTRLIPLSYVQPEDILPVLTPHKSEPGKIIVINKTKNLLLIDEPQRVETMAGLVKARDVALETRTFILRHVTAPEIKPRIEKLLSSDIGSVQYGEKNLKAMTVTDTAEQIAVIAEKITALDREIEVALVGQVIQIALNEDHQKGIDWEAIVTNYKRIDIPPPGGGADGPSGKLSLGTISQEDSAVLKEALGTVGIMEILSAPSMTVKFKQEAGVPLALTKPFQLLIPPVSYDFHLELAVLLAAVEDQVVRLKLNPQFHWLSSDNAPLPVTSSPLEISLQDSEMIVLGGLFQQKKITLEKRAPFIGGLPVVGSFFKKHLDRVEKTEFVIFLTPKIMIEKEDLP